MAIVEGKQGMRIGNMPSIDAVTQDGFIIYSDDGIHTYKMTIAEFAQAIGVVMTGGGDGDGGGGLLYWNEESERIFRDIIEEATYDDRKITWNEAAAIVYEIIGVGRMTHTGVTNENGYTSNFGSTSEIYLPDYTDQSGTTWTYPRATKLKFNKVVNAASTIRYPALNDSLLQPNSAYYCNVLNKDALLPKCFSQLDTKLTFEDIIINPLVKAVHMGSKDGVPGFDEEGLVTLEYDRIYAMGQDRVYFGKINLNAVHQYSPVNRMGGWVEGEGWSVYSTNEQHPEKYDTREEAEADLAAAGAAMSDNSMIGVRNPKAGTYEYYFTLYCIGNPKSLGQAQFAKDQQHLEPIIEVGYFPWQLARDYTVMREGNARSDTSYLGDCYYLNFSLDDEQIYYGYPTLMDGSEEYWRCGHGISNARYIDTVCYKDQNTGYIFPSPYLRFTPIYDSESHPVIPTPEYYDDVYDGVNNSYDPYTWPDGSTLVYTTYSEALQAPMQMATYWDKADFGGAYFQDDDGTIWYIILTGATRENASPWYREWGSVREGISMDEIVTSLPQEFDKYPTALNITMDHWCYDGVEDHTVYNGLGNDDKIAFVPHIQEHRYTDPDTQEVTYKYSGYLTQQIVSLKTEYLLNAYHKIQNIGKAVLAELGLKGIRPLWPTDAIGIHSEISATSESALNGGYYRQGNHYEETYNLDAMEGSLYLKGDAYDNGEKVKDKYQRKLIEGENITIENDENGNPVISASGGGGGGSVDVEAAYDSVYKRLDISGLNGKTIKILDGGGAHFEIVDGYDGTSGSEIRIKNSIDFLNGTNLVHGEVKPYGSSYSANAGKVELDLSLDAKGNIPKKIRGGKHVYIYSAGSDQDGYTIDDGDNSHQNLLYTDCIDTIKKNGVALTKVYDAQTGSYYVDLATGGGSSNPFTVDIGGNYVGSQYVDSNINSFTKLGSIYVQPNDNYCWIQVEVALQSLWSDSEAADSKFILEVRKDGYTGDIVDGNYPSNMSLRSLYFTDVRPVMHDDIVSLWTKLSVSGLVNYTGTDPVKFDVRVKQNTGNRKMVSWRAAVVYVAPAS